MDGLIATTGLLAAVATDAQGGISIPEPSNLGLFALGAAGVLIGRFLIKPRHRDED